MITRDSDASEKFLPDSNNFKNIGQAKSEQTLAFHLCLTDCLHMRDNQKAISVGFHLTTIQMLHVTLTALILSELCVTCNLFHPFEIHPYAEGRT